MTREEIQAKNAELYRLMSDNVLDALGDMLKYEIEQIRGKGVLIPKKYPDGALAWVYDDFIELNYNHRICGFMDRRSGTFYNTVRIFCKDSTFHRELDEVFCQFFIDERQPNTKEVYVYGLDMP